MALLPKPGETRWGFTATESGRIHMLGAETLELYHEKSGARLLYIKNDDKELGFNIIYRTPQLDETDACHMLEHLILCSCSKYPSRDIFFDMDSKSYATFMNGITDNTYTCYPVCTQSENQLIRLVDVLLCCMEEPDALKDENFFLREGIRFELAEPKGPLTMQGTVLSEDWAHLTDLEENADSHMAHALYEGQTAANLLGRAHLHYREISFEKVKEVYERFYHYSNSLMILYGDLDLERMLAFLDREHLNGHEKHVSVCDHPAAPFPFSLLHHPVRPGFRELTAQSPAYEGSDCGHASIIDYAIDLSECSCEELICWELFTGMLDSDNSPWHSIARDMGLNQVLEVYVDSLMAKPALKFRLKNGEDCQKTAFLQSIKKAFAHVSRHGISPDLFQASIKENRISDCLTREASHLGFNISEEIGRYWSLTERTGYFELYEAAFETFSRDKEQSILRRLASMALKPAASALVVTVPAPGLAERLEKEKRTFLEEKRASLTASQTAQLVEQTKVFHSWSALDKSNMDFLIDPEELPEPEKVPFFQIHSRDGITFYSTPVEAASIGCYQIFFDISEIQPEDWNYLTLYQMLLTELSTPRFTSGQQKNLEQFYLHDCIFNELYPGPEAGENSHPMMSVLWYGLTEDFEKSLDFLLDIMGNGDYSDRTTILRVLEKYLPDYDLSSPDNASSLAYSLSEAHIRQDSCFRFLLNHPDLYYFLKDVQECLKKEEKNPADTALTETTGASLTGAGITCRLQSTAKKILGRGRLIFLTAAPKTALEAIEQTAFSFFRQLPAITGPDTPAVLLPPQPGKAAACIDSPSQEIRMLGDLKAASDFKGRYLPFLLAAADKYIKPAIRYQGSAYDSGIDFLLPNGYFTLWSTADPEVRSTAEIFRATGKQLADLTITPEELKGYILSAYAQALPPSGMLNSPMRYMRRHLMGIDTDAVSEMTADIKNASLADQPEAARIIDELLSKGPLSVVGNEKAIRESADIFDNIIYVRKPRSASDS